MKRVRLLDLGLWYRRDNPQCFAVTGPSKPRPIYMNWLQLSPAEVSDPFSPACALLLPPPVHVSLERYLDWPFADLIIVPAMDGASRSYKLVQDFIGRGANNMLEVQTFQYIIQNEAGETIGGYTSTEEPPLKGDVITLHDIPDWESAEVLGVTMLLAKHYNEIVVKVRSADRYPL